MKENEHLIKDAKTAADFLPYVQSAYWEHGVGGDEVSQNGQKRYRVSFIDGSVVSNTGDNGLIETVSPGIVATRFIDAGITLTDIPAMEEINGLYWSSVCENVSVDQAVEMAKKYGEGWRLPTSIEMVGVSAADLVEHGEFIQEFRWTPAGIDYGPDSMSICQFHFDDRINVQGKSREPDKTLNARFVKEIDQEQRRMLVLSIGGNGMEIGGTSSPRENFFGSFGKDAKASNIYNTQSFKR